MRYTYSYIYVYVRQIRDSHTYTYTSAQDAPLSHTRVTTLVKKKNAHAYTYMSTCIYVYVSTRRASLTHQGSRYTCKKKKGPDCLPWGAPLFRPGIERRRE